MTNATTLLCPNCSYDNIVVTCGFCLQCGADLVPVVPSTTSSVDIDNSSDEDICSVEGQLQTIAQRFGSELEPSRCGWQIVVTLPNQRKQSVQVWLDKEEPHLLGLMSLCGPASPSNAMTLLKWNSHLRYCAFAVRMIDDQPMLVVSAACPTEASTTAHWYDTIRSVATRADQVEDKLSQGADRF